MDRFLTRPQSPVLITQGDPEKYISTLMADHNSQKALLPHFPSPSQSVLNPELLNVKLQALAQQLTRGIAQEVGKISRELRAEIDQLGEYTATLEIKFDETLQYVQALEEKNTSLKNSVSLLQLQQEDLENRERRQNLRICGVLENVADNNIRPYLIGLFNHLTPNIVDIDWRLDWTHRSLT